MKSFLVQLNNTLPESWSEIDANNIDEAVENMLHFSGVIERGERPSKCFVGLGIHRHENGAPIAIQEFALKY